MLTLFSRLINLKRISDFYSLLRNYKSTKDGQKIWDKLTQITEFKELIQKERMEALKGNKTYIVAGLAGAATVAKFLGLIDEGTWQTIMGFLGAAGGMTLAAKINHNTLISKQAEYKVNALLNQSSMINMGQGINPNLMQTGMLDPNARSKAPGNVRVETKYNPPKTNR